MGRRRLRHVPADDLIHCGAQEETERDVGLIKCPLIKRGDASQAVLAGINVGSLLCVQAWMLYYMMYSIINLNT